MIRLEKFYDLISRNATVTLTNRSSTPPSLRAACETFRTISATA